MTKYYRLGHNEWIEPTRTGHHGCCDCGLVHEVDFKITTAGRKIPKLEMRWRRDERATAAMRKAKRFTNDRTKARNGKQANGRAGAVRAAGESKSADRAMHGITAGPTSDNSPPKPS